MSTSTLDPGQGVRSVASLPTAQNADEWKTIISQIDFNGEVPFTALLASMPSQTTPNPVFHWFDEAITAQNFTDTTGTMVYEDANLSDPYDDSDDYAAGSTVYVKVNASFVAEVVVSHIVLLRDANDHTNDIQARVTARNTANNSLVCNTLVADGTGAGDLSDADTVVIIGYGNPELGQVPNAVAYDPTDLVNYTQIFNTSLAMSGTQLATTFRTESEYIRQKGLAFMRHLREMERAFLFGEQQSTTGDNGMPLRLTRGYVTALRTHTSANVDNFRLSDTNYNGKTWIAADGGNAWLNEMLETVFLFGSGEKMAFMGNTSARALQRIPENLATINVNSGNKMLKWGLKVTEVITPYGTVNVKIHPLFNQVPSLRDSMFIFEPEQMTFRPLEGRDTTYLPDPTRNQGGLANLDGIIEAFRTEAGLEYHHTETSMFLEGLGSDNP